MQKPSERIKAAIHFEKPDKLPVEFETFNDKDTYIANLNFPGSGSFEAKESIDDWGCVWRRSNLRNMGQVAKFPLSNWNFLDKYKFPDPDKELLYDNFVEKLDKGEDKYVITQLCPFTFTRLHFLRGFENTMTDFYEEEEKIDYLIRKITDYEIRIIHNIAQLSKERIHGILFCDDWGTERSGFISPEMWDRFFKKEYKRVFDACKKSGWDIWLHTCGKMNDYIPSLLEIGLDVLNLQQPLVNGIRETGEKFAGKVCFSSLCDIQKTLLFGTADEIEEQAIELMKYWGTPDGGFILSDYNDAQAIGVGEERKKIMYDAFKTHDRWKNKK